MLIGVTKLVLNWVTLNCVFLPSSQELLGLTPIPPMTPIKNKRQLTENGQAVFMLLYFLSPNFPSPSLQGGWYSGSSRSFVRCVLPALLFNLLQSIQQR